MGYAQRLMPHYTYDDYIQWEGRWELIDGHPIAMSPSPIAKHQLIANMLQFEFTSALRDAGCKDCKVYPFLDFKIAEDTVVQPDISIACDVTDQKFLSLEFPPVLVVEILSPSTSLRDRHIKFDIYESQGIKYYLLVDVDKNSFELYLLTDGKYILLSHDFNQPFGFAFNSAGCGASVTLNNVW